VALIIVGAVIVAVAVPRAVEDWSYQLAGLADPFLGRPAPGVTIIIGGIVSAVLLVVGLIRARPRRWAIGSIFAWPVLLFWAAYGAAAAATVAGGGQSTYAGTLVYDFRPAIDHEATVPATCHTPVGKPSVLSDVRPSTDDPTAAVGGLPMLWLRHEATGGRARTGEMAEPIRLALGDGRTLPPYPVPGTSDRPRPYLEVTMGDGTDVTEAPIDFLQAYAYRIAAIDDRGLSGTATLQAERWPDPYDPNGGLRWVDLVIEDDPWPISFQVSVAWTCGQASG
jgi:hypothetical protein